MVQIACDNLQVGINTIPILLYENSEALENVADVFKDTFGTSWDFFDKAVNDPATYTFVFEVTEECTNTPLTTQDEIDGSLVVFEWDKEKRYT